MIPFLTILLIPHMIVQRKLSYQFQRCANSALSSQGNHLTDPEEVGNNGVHIDAAFLEDSYTDILDDDWDTFEQEEGLSPNMMSFNNSSTDNNETVSMASLLRSIQLAPASEIAYFYLQNRIGLSESTMWKITMEAGSVLGFTVANLEKKIENLRTLLDLSDSDIQILLTKQPSILHLSPTKNVSPTVDFLRTSLDLDKAQLRSMVVAYPSILCYSLENLNRKILFFLQDMAFTKEQARLLLTTQPNLLCAAVTTALLPRFRFLHKEMAMALSDLQTILLKNPRILLYSMEMNVRPKLIDFFILRLQFRPAHIVQILKSYPFIMDYSLDHHMLPIITFFLVELDFSPMEMRRILMKFPRLVSFSLVKIKYVARLLRYQLGMNAQEVKRIFFQAPQIVSLSVDKTLMVKVTFLQSYLGFVQETSPQEGQVMMDVKLRKILVGMPTVLLCSIENNLKPKLEFILSQVDGDISELRDIIMTLPPLLGYSLEKRIRPRMIRMAEMGVGPPRVITTAITMKDEMFEHWLAGRIQTDSILDKDTPETIREIKTQRLLQDKRIIHWNQ